MATDLRTHKHLWENLLGWKTSARRIFKYHQQTNHKKLNYFNITSVYICQPFGMRIPSNLKNLSILFFCFLPPFSWNIPLCLKWPYWYLFVLLSRHSKDLLCISKIFFYRFKLCRSTNNTWSVQSTWWALVQSWSYLSPFNFSALSSLSAARTVSSRCTLCMAGVCAPFFCLSPAPWWCVQGQKL